MENNRRSLFKLINCADNDSRAGREILEGLRDGKKEWDALTAQEWALLYRFIEQTPGTPQHAAANTGYNRQDMATAAAILHAIRDGIGNEYIDQWETMTANELLEMIDRQASR